MNSKQKKCIIWICSVLGAVIVLASGLLIYLFATAKPKTQVVAFYNVPQNQKQELQTILQNYNPEFEFLELNEMPTKKQLKNISLMFSINGKATQKFNSYSKPLSRELLTSLPSNIARAFIHTSGDVLALPVLMDHFELAYYRTYPIEKGLSFPQHLEDIKTYLSSLCDLASVSAICLGSDSRELLGFVSSLCLSRFGARDYNLLVEKLNTTYDIESGKFPPELEDTLDYIRGFMDEKLISPLFLEMNETDMDFYIRQHQLSLIAMSLSQHRRREPTYIKYYQTAEFPAAMDIKDQGIIAPTLTVQLFEKGIIKEDTIKFLLSPEVQGRLSDTTKLAPVTSRAECYDIQADDLRYYAATVPAGPLPSLADSVCSGKQQQEAFAQHIRNYLLK